MIYRITYWTAGDAKVTKDVTADTLEKAEAILVNDPQAPLAQIVGVIVLPNVTSE